MDCKYYTETRWEKNYIVGHSFAYTRIFCTVFAPRMEIFNNSSDDYLDKRDKCKNCNLYKKTKN